jgi:ABC-type phosphate transport system substrate-binding protein
MLAVSAVAAAADAPRLRVSFVVSSHRPVRNLSLGDLRRIYLGQMSRWSDGHRIVLLMRPTQSQESIILLDRVIRMSDIDYSRWWLGAVFRGEAARAPREIPTADSIVRAVAANPDAIGFILTSSVDLPPNVVALRIDGHTPFDRDYPVAH